MTTIHCDHCPVTSGEPCASIRHPRYCVLAATRPEYIEIIVEASTGVHPEPIAATPDSPRRDFNALRMLAFACDYRGPQAQCGCTQTNVCWKGEAGKGRRNAEGTWDATLQECFECVK